MPFEMQQLARQVSPAYVTLSASYGLPPGLEAPPGLEDLLEGLATDAKSPVRTKVLLPPPGVFFKPQARKLEPANFGSSSINSEPDNFGISSINSEPDSFASSDETWSSSEKSAGKNAAKDVAAMKSAALCWADLGSERENRTTLRLQPLPHSMCQPGVLERMLENANVEASVQSRQVHTIRTKMVGTAVIKAASPADVKKIAKLLHGRTWGRSLPVSVQFASSTALLGSGKVMGNSRLQSTASLQGFKEFLQQQQNSSIPAARLPPTKCF